MKSVAYIVLALVVVFAFATSVPAQESESKEAAEKAKESTLKAAAEETKAEKKEETVKNPIVLFETNYGNIILEMLQKEAPISVKNYVSYVEEGFYDNTVFHRVVSGKLIQAGGMTEDMQRKKTKDPIKNEAKNGLSNVRGTVSVARMTGKDTGTSHFFINIVDNTYLDHSGEDDRSYGYAVFAKVVGGMDVVDAIGKAEIKGGAKDGAPVKPVVIKKARVVDVEKEMKKVKEEKSEEKSEEKIKKEQKQMKED
jgi:cyclophilin family peptidyl-prolyl cis-trans isomerase